MFHCYVDTARDVGRTKPTVTICAALVVHEDGSPYFEHRWRQLLLTHELERFDVRNWRETAERERFSTEKRRAVLADFANALAAPENVGQVVAVDMAAWAGIDASPRSAFGNADAFCFQRLVRLVLDRLEAIKSSEPIELVLDRPVDALVRHAASIEEAFQRDSRAEARIRSIRFAAPGHVGHLQAAGLLATLAEADLARRQGGAEPQRLKPLAEWPPTPTGTHLEFWDRSHFERHLTSLEWQLPEGRKGSRKSRR